MAPIPDDVRPLIEGTNFVHVATVMPDGSPASVAVWFGIDPDDRDRLEIYTQEVSRKAQNLLRDPRLAMSVVDMADPYRTARLRGKVVEILRGDEGQAVGDRLARKYTGEDFPFRGPQPIGFKVEVTSAALMELPFRYES